LFQLAYSSAARAPFTTDALQLLLVKAREANALQKVTGMLLYHAGSFLQVLEGPEAGVERIFASIQRDPRHHLIQVLFRNLTEDREFAEWYMGFIDTSNWHIAPGMIDYHRIPQVATAPTAAQRYLRLFHQGLCRQASLA
jgi:hypothetical protein